METQKDYSSEKLRTFAEGERELIKETLNKSQKLKGENGAGLNKPTQSSHNQKMKGGKNDNKTKS